MREVITFRPQRSKRALRAAFGNISRKMNELIERELQASVQPPDWRDALKGNAPNSSEEAYTLCLRPE